MKTVEDLLETLAGIQGQMNIKIDSSDVTILYSIARQVFKGTALTDRQFSVVKEKLIKYKDQFDNCNFNLAVETLRMPLREIDRSKYIKIVSHEEMVEPNYGYESYKQNWKWIKLRFPFSKKLILALQDIPHKHDEYLHEKGTHEHYFALTEKNVWNVVKAFKDKEFNIENKLIDAFNMLNAMQENKHEYIPGVYNLKLKTITENSHDYIINQLGTPTIENLALFKDKKDMLGLHHFDNNDIEKSLGYYTSLSQRIVNRGSKTLMVNSDKHTFDNLAYSLIELKRFPLLVVLPEQNTLDFLVRVHKTFKNFINVTESTVMFRLDNANNHNFNNYIRDNNLNNSLDKNTKIVYISTNKVPKPLLKSDWKGNTVLMLQSVRSNLTISQYTEEFDLLLQYDNNMSQFMRVRKNTIQEI